MPTTCCWSWLLHPHFRKCFRDNLQRFAWTARLPLLRRPISINYVDRQRNEVWFLIQLVGDGTKRLGEAKAGDIINVVLPLGNCFTMPEKPSDKLLLVGGGVGTAPMLYLGEQLAKKGCKPTFLLGARSDKDLLQLNNLPPMARCIPPPKMAATERRDT